MALVLCWGIFVLQSFYVDALLCLCRQRGFQTASIWPVLEIGSAQDGETSVPETAVADFVSKPGAPAAVSRFFVMQRSLRYHGFA